jgi:flagellar assembly protein FliH
LSPDVIKKGEFRSLYQPADAPEDEGDDGILRARRYESHRVRFRELLDRLAEAEDRERRNVEKAARRAREEAEAEAREEYGRAADVFLGMADRLREAIDARTEIAREEIVELAVAIAGKIVRREIRRDDEFVVRLVRVCLRNIAGLSSVRVRLNPADHALVSERADDLAAEAGLHDGFSTVADRRVDPGGCIVETPDFVVDGTIRTQMTTARRVLQGDGE